MWQTVPDAIDRFPGDLMASLRAGMISAVVLGVTSWWLARWYLQRTYFGHVELLSAAIVVGVMDGILLGIGGFMLTYVVRVWRYERRLRRTSDDALRRELGALVKSAEGWNERTDIQRPS